MATKEAHYQPIDCGRTRLSCHRFVPNQVGLALFILAYNLGNFLRKVCLPKGGQTLVVAKPPGQVH